MTFDLPAAKKRLKWLEMARAAWDSPDSQPVSFATFEKYKQEYRRVAFEDHPAAIARIEWYEEILKRAKGYLNSWKLFNVEGIPPEALEHFEEFLHDLEKGPPDDMA